MMKTLVLGAGSKKYTTRNFRLSDWPALYDEVVRLDFAETHSPDVVWDLNNAPWPFSDNEFDEVLAEEVLEHLGQQGDFKSFFRTFAEIYRVLKPDGVLAGHSPGAQSPWLWGDPGHCRAITPEALVFLCQPQYTKQVGVTPMSDYRKWWRGDFDILYSQDQAGTHAFVLKAIKPSRIKE